MSREIRYLSDEMELAFTEGILQPLLGVVQRDRDLVLEFRDPRVADIYCKGQCLEIEKCGDGYKISAHQKFLKDGALMFQSAEKADSFVKEELPFVKQRMAEHRSGGLEIEFQQALIRANNLEPNLNTDYFAVDSQVFLGPGQDHIDVLGIYWPDHRSDEDVALALIEVKFGLKGGIEKLAEQVDGYYNALDENISRIADHTQKMLRQKLRMGLITGGSVEAMKKLQRLNVSTDPKRVKIVVAMVEPRSTFDSVKCADPNSPAVEIKEGSETPYRGVSSWIRVVGGERSPRDLNSPRKRGN